MHLSNHSTVYEIGTIMFSGAMLVLILFRRRVRIPEYTLLEFIFIAFNVGVLILGLVEFQSNVMSRLITLVINLILNLILFEYLVDKGRIIRFLKCYLYSGLIFQLILLLADFRNIGSSRLAWDMKRIVGGGIYQSNNIAFICNMTFLIGLYLYFKDRKKIYLAVSGFSTIVCLLTGSRKSIILIAFGGILFYLLQSKKNTMLKAISSVLILGFGIFVMYEVPIFYNIIGWRIAEMINLFKGNEVLDTSAITRMRLIDLAILKIGQKPLWGYGLGTFRLIPEANGLYSHNDYLEVAYSSGLIGLGIYLLLFIRGLVISFKKHLESYLEGTLFTVIITSLLIQSISMVTYLKHEILIFVLAAYAINNIERSQKLEV